MVGDKLKAWRKRNGKNGKPLSTRDAAQRADVSQPVWLALENGSGKRIGLDVAAKIVALLDGDLALTDLVADPDVARKLARRQRSTPPPPRRVA